MKLVNRTAKVPMYIFSELDKIKKDMINNGVDIIDLGIGDPDIETPDFIVNYMCECVKNKENHRYPPYRGIDEFRISVAEYYKKTFNVELDYETEVAALIGSKEGIAHLILGLTDNEDYILIPDPAYPVYNASAVISGCNVYKMNLQEKYNYLPRLDNIYEEVARKAKLMIVNYPNNPTGAVADRDFYRSLVDFGREYDIPIANDGAYMDIVSSGKEPISLLQTEGAKDICVEFGSLSKSFNMTGWRIGYVAGNREIIDKLMLIKTNFDSSQFSAIQQAGALALDEGKSYTESFNRIYDERRNIMVKALKEKGIYSYDSKGAFYVWIKNPEGYKSQELAYYMLKNAGVLITPGSAFGDMGEGYCRISLTVASERLVEAAERIGKLKFI